MSKYSKQIIEKMVRIEETLEAIRAELSEIKEKLVHQPARESTGGQAKKLDVVNNAVKGTVWEKYPEQYRRLLAIVGSLSFDAWFGSVRSIEVKDDSLYLIVEDEFIKNALSARYSKELKHVFSVEKVFINSLENRD